jgi:hypothetical protein
MFKDKEIIHEALFRLEQLTGTKSEVISQSDKIDAFLTIADKKFISEVKSEVRASNKGMVLSRINELKNNNEVPVLLIAKYIASDIATEFQNRNINYIDTAGNAFLKEGELFIFITGQKTQKISKTNQSRAFQEAGIKLIFCLLDGPENLQLPYRSIADIAGIAVGSISNIINELIDLAFILKIDSKRKQLKNTRELLNRWIISYNDILRPRLVKKKMRFSSGNDIEKWKNISLHKIEGVNLWGGEPGASIITNQLKPSFFTIYTDGNWQNIAKELKLIPDEQGVIEILGTFWDTSDCDAQNKTVPALLIYADLISSGYERNIQIANEILENELQHIK